MFNVCYRCGEYRADKEIDPSGPYAICPVCGYRHAFRQLPLLIVGGASGAGKSTVLQALTGRVAEAVLLDSDILWRPEFDQPEEGYRRYFETWLRMAKNLCQSGRPVVLFGAGLGVPGNIEPRVERRYFSQVRYLALTASDEAITARLQARPQWRKSADPAFLAAQLDFNRWFVTEAIRGEPPVELLDTTGQPVSETAGQVAAWIRTHSVGHNAR